MLLTALITAALAASTVGANSHSKTLKSLEKGLTKSAFEVPKNAIESWAIAQKHAKTTSKGAVAVQATDDLAGSIGWATFYTYENDNCGGAKMVSSAQFGTCLVGKLPGISDYSASQFVTYNGVVNGEDSFTAVSYTTTTCTGAVQSTNTMSFATGCDGTTFQWKGVSDSFTLPGNGYFSQLYYNTMSECDSNTDYSDVESSSSLPTGTCVGGQKINSCSKVTSYSNSDCSGSSTSFSIPNSVYGGCMDDDDDFDDDDDDGDDDFVADTYVMLECQSGAASLAAPSVLAAALVAVAAFLV